MADDIQFDGDPRKLALAIYRAALASYKQKHGALHNPAQARIEIEAEIPKLAQQMAEALEGNVRDVYLMNALELMALDYVRQDL